MRAITAHQGHVRLTDIPKPTLLAADDIIIRVRLVGLCRTDLYVAQGQIAAKPNVVLGHEFCGEVEAVGPAVTHVVPGQRVGIMPIRTGPQDTLLALGKDEDGAFAEYVRVSASQVHAVPDTLSDEQAAYLEPVAASLAVLQTPIKPTMRGAVYGDNRIAALTCAILKHAGFVVETPATETSMQPSSYDFIVETSATPEALQAMVTALKPQGILILKSRPYTDISLPFTRIVEKELRLFGAHYAPFEEAIALMASAAIDTRDMFGSVASFEEAAAILSGTRTSHEHRKLFFRP